MLEAWFKGDPTRSRVALGERLGITGQAVSGWLRVISRPNEGRERELLEHATGIPVDAWMTDAERIEREAAIAHARGSLTGTD